MASELEELVGFLSCPSNQLRKAAVDIVRDLTGSEDGLRSLSAFSAMVLPALVRLLQDSSAELAAPATEALINLSQDAGVAEKMVYGGTVQSAMDALYSSSGAAISRLLVMLLVNLTQIDAGINAILQVGDDKLEGLYISKLVRSFCRSIHGETEGEDPFEHVGSILVNVSKNEAGRRVLLDSKKFLLRQILPQFDSSSPLRKKGISGTVRNCCFEADNQLQNLLSVSEFLWPILLLPVAGKKVYEKEDLSKMPQELATALSHEREAIEDPEIRIQALESVYLLSLQDAGLRALWSINGPRILEVGYEDEDDPKVMEAYEQIGSLLVSSSGAEN